MSAVGRNQPCPCGSGKRYKDCHGAIVAGRETTSSSDADPVRARAEYEAGRYEHAIALLRRAIELQPEREMPRQQLHVLESMLRFEEGICRELLPRLVTRVEPVADVARFASSASEVHLVLVDDPDTEEQQLLERLRHALGSRHELWTQSGMVFSAERARLVAADRGAHPRGGLVALFGVSRSQAAWLDAARPERVLLTLARDEPCALIDRIDEVSLLCDLTPGVVCATPALAERLGLPVQAAMREAHADTRS
jgi:hypothetical protein